MTLLTAAERDQLARFHIGYPRALAHRMRHPSDEYDEVVGDALLGFAEALARYDNTRGAFLGYAHRRITGAIKDGQRRRDHLTRAHRTGLAAGPALLSELPPDSLNAIPPGHTSEQGDLLEAGTADPIDRLLIRAELRSLPARQRLVLLLRADWGLSLREIGTMLGVTESRVCQIDMAARARLALQLTEAA